MLWTCKAVFGTTQNHKDPYFNQLSQHNSFMYESIQCM